MGTTAQKLAAVASSKAKIDAALTARGITPPTKFADYGDAVRMLSKVWDAEIEYLQSVNTGNINTGISFGSSDSVRFVGTMAITSLASNTFFFGSKDDAGNALYLQGNGSGACMFVIGTIASSSNVVKSSYSAGTMFDFDLSVSQTDDTVSGTINGTAKSGSFTGTVSSRPIRIFGYDNNGTMSGMKNTYRVAKFAVYKNGALAFDGIPVRTSSVGYLYDRVSGQLFGNAGTGDFTLGPDKS